MQADSVRGKLGSVAHMSGQTVQAMKLLDLFGKITEAGQQLRLSTAESMTSEIHQLRLQLLANIVQLLVPLAPVSDITTSLIASFREVAAGAGLRYCPCLLQGSAVQYSSAHYSTSLQSRPCLATAHCLT